MLRWTAALYCFTGAMVHAIMVTEQSQSMMSQNASDLGNRHLEEELHCDLDLYNEFIESEGGQDTFIMAALCESRIVHLKNARAGWFGPVSQVDLSVVMCSNECLRSDKLHTMAMSLSHCTCAEVSTGTSVRYDFCLENSARLLCTHLSECGHWGCQLEDFNCLRYEWDRLYPCDSSCIDTSVAVWMIVLATSFFML